MCAHTAVSLRLKMFFGACMWDINPGKRRQRDWWRAACGGPHNWREANRVLTIEASRRPQFQRHVGVWPHRTCEHESEEMTWVEKIAILHEAATTISDTRATWHKGSKETAKRDEDVVAMSEHFKEHESEALKMRRVAEKYATKRRSSVYRENFRRENLNTACAVQAGPGTRPEGTLTKSMRNCGVCPRAQVPKVNILIHDWDTVLALAAGTGVEKQINDMTDVWVSIADPGD